MDMNNDKLTAKKVTIYVKGEFMGNFHKVEATAYLVELVPYAQYADAVRFVFKGKGKRLLRAAVQTFRPSLVVLEGWGHIDPPGMWGGKAVESAGVTLVQSTYTSCDEGWNHDFNKLLTDYVAKSGAKILHDFRNHTPGMRP